MNAAGALRAVLFDFDGTLADTAPDLGGALNRLREQHALAPLPIEAVRPYASSGARGLLRLGFDLGPGDATYEQMRQAFLTHYAAAICVETRLFPGIAELLAHLERRDIAWGIVTNKATRFTERLVDLLGLAQRASCVVSGDTTAHMKPHPAPLLVAAERLALAPAQCGYVGDDLRDMQAAQAAGMVSIAVEYGYGSRDPGPRQWNADAVIAQPMDLIGRLQTPYAIMLKT
ncbi:MAG: HAD-IA family hydrolase [Betaproteobacteria bacterium]|nr:HAD-IA family hydrolase [Betaproteobacteria bacterium]